MDKNVLKLDVYSSPTKINANQMFGLFKKDPVKKLEKKHKQLMEEAMNIQRSGDLRLYAKKIEEAEKVEQKILDLKANP
jgi:hypothetical protein